MNIPVTSAAKKTTKWEANDALLTIGLLIFLVSFGLFVTFLIDNDPVYVSQYDKTLGYTVLFALCAIVAYLFLSITLSLILRLLIIVGLLTVMSGLGWASTRYEHGSTELIALSITSWLVLPVAFVFMTVHCRIKEAPPTR